MTALLQAPAGRNLPPGIQTWLEGRGIPIVRVEQADDVVATCLRGRPRLILLDGRGKAEDVVVALLERIKGDAYTGVIPSVVFTDPRPECIERAFAAGADEVLSDSFTEAEARIRLDVVLRRSDRDVMVHPSTRLPGAVEIDAEIGRRMADDVAFAACYADLDHFKEFNDRYSYYQGDRVIRILSMILHDLVKGLCGREGFVGHIGGDDFIFLIPIDPVHEVCTEIISVFDELIPLQYAAADREAGYFFGKDRRGQVHRVPLMTVSIGVVTTERRHFTHAAQVSALATEMKNYAKTLPGSVYAIDRRTDNREEETRPSGPLRLMSDFHRDGADS